MARPGAAMWMPSTTCRAQALHRQRVVDLGGLRVVDGKACTGGQRQVVLDGGAASAGKPVPLGKLSNRKRRQWNW
jgi:hypothetical protein